MGRIASDRPYQDDQGFMTFRQYWFAGNHSDIGGSYPENESRLSDIALAWMIDAAAAVRGGIEIDKSVLQPYPSADGMQHDQRKAGFPVLTKWTQITWPGGPRKIQDSQAPLHDSVYERFKLPAVVQYDVARPYRPEAIRGHEHLAEYYKDISEPKPQTRIVAYIKSFFLAA